MENSGADSGVCCLVPKGGLRLGRLGTVSPQVLTAQLFRWPQVREEGELVQVEALCKNQDELFVCCNPWHWARALTPGMNLQKILDEDLILVQSKIKAVWERKATQNRHFGLI